MFGIYIKQMNLDNTYTNLRLGYIKRRKIMSEVVWSVNILLAIGLLGTAYVLYYILTLDSNEEKNTSNTHSSEVTDE
jgi:hypothetical protein